MNTSYLYRCTRARQYGGATLLFVLIMLLVVSIIGVSSVKSTLIQERMASNTNVRNTVFEAAESALAVGEIRVANTPEIWNEIKAAKPGDCLDGLCDRNTSIQPKWIGTHLWNNPDEYRAVDSVKNGPVKVKDPRYIIEDLGQTMASCDPNHIDITQSADCPYTSAQRYFRVVSYAEAYGTQVMLQSTYLDPNPTRSEAEPASPWRAEDPKCDEKPYQPPGEQCCPPDTDHPREWKHSGSTCPSYCETKPGTTEKYDPSTQQCCDPSPINNERSIISSAAECPSYCGNNVIDNSKEVCCNVQGTWSVYPGTNSNTDCPQYCGNEPRGPGQVCCWKGGESYSYTANSESECPDFCDVGGTQTQLNAGQKCCPDASRTGWQIINGKDCPNYCDSKVLQPGQKCCNIPPIANGNKSGGQRIVNAGQACPVFCGANEILPGQACCGNHAATQKIFDPKTQQCCKGSNNATKVIGINELCCSDSEGNPIANSAGECPIYCGRGATAIRVYEGEECCTSAWSSSPVKADKSTQICCNGAAIPKTVSGQCPEQCNGQEFDPGLQQCCTDWDDRGYSRKKAPGEKNKCPIYCRAPGSPGHNQLLPPGERCCTDSTADNYGEIGVCDGGSGSTAGS